MEFIILHYGIDYFIIKSMNAIKTLSIELVPAANRIRINKNRL